MNLAAPSYLLAALAFLVLVVLALWTWRQRPGSLWIAVAALLSVIWALHMAFVAHEIGETPVSGGAFEVLRNAGWFAVLFALLVRRGESGSRPPAPLRAAMIATAALMAGLFVALALPVALPLGAWVGIAMLGMVVLGLVLVEQVFRNTPLQRRWEIKFLSLGLGAMFAFDLFLYADLVLFGAINSPVWQARGLVNALVVPLLAISLARRPLQAREAPVVSRHLLFHTAALIGAGLYLLAIGAAAYYLQHVGGDLGAFLQVVFLFGAALLLAVIVASGSLRSRLRVFLAKHFFRYSFDYRQEWLRFTGTLSAEDDEIPFRQRAIQAIGELVDSPGGLLWVRDRNGTYALEGVLNLGDPSYPPEEPDGALVEFVARTGWVIDLNEYRRDPELYQGLQLPEWLVGNARLWVVVPLLKGDLLQGFVVLAHPRAPRKIDWEERDLLKTAGRQLAIYVALVQTDEALLEARQFEAFHRLAAFLVHDLKNVSAQLSLVCSNAERHLSNPDFVRDALRTVGNARDRLERTLAQLRHAQATPETPSRIIPLDRLLAEVSEASRHRSPLPRLDLREPAAVTGDQEGLKNVLLNLVRNAQEATPDDGSINLNLYTEEGWAIVQIEDTGSGMDPAFLKNRLFKPFQTTKGNAGMGIGLYEARDRISRMGGRISVDSEAGVGTTFTLKLPLQVAPALAEPS
ncbi:MULTISPECIES: XrtA/PEP-CTERM system histidine kinase PrsK [unclassified Thioalkalivibrio]|uniref:XrtA/PEP-CTERM system histidine kinase PrsK n=1 Tax=unclassified Thioalkalivibrio TaxID=2621013 RepID=UPI00036F9197|nr:MULTISPECIES: XrtA/PEP-CTERM system histidine kinase PrsK [unclassified Thioalkalivibrio]